MKKNTLPGFEEAVEQSYQHEPGHKCPFCRTKLNKSMLIMSWKYIRSFFVEQRKQIARQVVLEEIYRHPDIEINPDLLFALRGEAGYDGLEVSDLINEIIDSYFLGKFDRLMRRKHNRRKLKVEAKNAHTSTRTK